MAAHWGVTMAADPRGRTQPVQSNVGRPDVPEAAPRLPHERDESSDSQQSHPRGVIRQAHEDVERGLVDTDRGTPAHDTYQRQKTPRKPG